MAVLDIDPGTGAGDGKRRLLLPWAEDLPRLALHLLLLAGDEGDDIVDHIERKHALLSARARDSLERRHQYGANAEGVVQRLERNGEAGRRAIRDRRDEPAPAALTALVMQRLGMRIVDARDQDGHVRLIAKGRCGADHRDAGRKARLPFQRDLFRDRAEDQVDRLGEQALVVEAAKREQRWIEPALGKPAAGAGRLAQRVAQGLPG